MERSRLTVSPFDGVSRIRFKGSPNIADLRLSIDSSPQIGNRKLAIANAQTLSPDLLQIGAPPKRYLIFKANEF